MNTKRFFVIVLLCFISSTALVKLYAAPAVNADYYYLFLNKNETSPATNNLSLTGVTSIVSQTSKLGQFTLISGGSVGYKINANQNGAGYDICTIQIGSDVKTIGVAVCAYRKIAVGYTPDTEYVFDLRNAFKDLDDFPENWKVEFRFFDYLYPNRTYKEAGVILPASGSANYFPADGRLYVDDVLVKEEVGNGGAVSFIDISVGAYDQIIKRIDEANRKYAFVDKRNRGLSVNKKPVHTVTSGRIYLMDNYSNSQNYGKFTLSTNNDTLYYESSPAYEEYGMDMQAFSVGTSTPTEIGYLGYGITISPVDKRVSKNGWTLLESRDIIKGLPRNYSVRYTYYNPVVNGTTIGFGTQVPNVAGSDLKATAYDIPLNSPFDSISPGDPGYPGGTATYATQTYVVKAELVQNMGPNTSTPRAASTPLPLCVIQSDIPAWLTQENYDQGLVKIQLDVPTFSVCPEKNESRLGYPVEVDLEVRTVAYKYIVNSNGDMVRDYNVQGFDMTPFSRYSGYYDKAGNIRIPVFNSTNHPYHMYKVGSERTGNVGFPHTGTNGTIYQDIYSYGTRLDDNTMAIYVRTKISKQDIWGSAAAAGDSILIPASQGEVKIERGICGELQETITCPKTNSLLYLQDFGGNEAEAPLFYNPDDAFTGAARSYSNIESAMEGSTYEYKNYARINTSSLTYPNHGLPYLDEGEHILTKETEQHFLSTSSSVPMWTRFHSDHTNPQDPARGYMMQINAGVEKGTFFDYEVSALCNGATMTFTAWIKNTVAVDNTNATQPADQIFETYDGETGKLLSRYYTGPILNPVNYNNGADLTNANAWKQYGFRFSLPVGTEKIRLKILNNGQGSNGNDFAIDDIEIRLCNETQITMTPPAEAVVCQENEIEVKVELANSDKKFFTWFYNPTGQINDTWLPLTSGEISEDYMTEPVITLYLNPYSFTVDQDLYPNFPTGYFRFALGYSPDFLEGNCYVITDPMAYRSTTLGEAYIWTGDANNGVWKDQANWLIFNPDGSTGGIGGFPAFCNDAFIPGNTDYFPEIADLDSCRNIYFFQGAQISNPEKLGYKRAFIEYNFGQVDGTSPVVSENKTDMQKNYASAPLNRGQWHIIASPLKKVTTGDFGFAGKPHTWQMKFESLRDEANNINYGQWSGNYHDADLELEVTHNAMALLVGHFVDNYVGLHDQEYINSVDGVIRLPYYYDMPSSYYKSHPLQEYNSKDGISYFYFYDYNNLIPNYKDTMYFSRKGEIGTRFVFEDDDKNPLTPYTYKLPANKDVMIGNPFVSLLDMDLFMADNNSVLASPVYYNFVGSYESEAEQKFNYYVMNGGSVPDPGIEKTAPRYVAPLKSFVVSTNDFNAVNDSVTITLNYSQTTVKQNTGGQFRSRAESGNSADMLLLSVEGKSGSSLLTLSFREIRAGNAGVLRMADSEIPSIYAIDPKKGSPNMVQFEGGYVRDVIPFGVFSSYEDEPLTIKAYNVDGLNVESLFLFDKLLNKKINLLQTDDYTFTGVKGMSNRFELHMVPKAPTTNLNENRTAEVEISAYDATVQISASLDNPIMEVEIFDVLGRAVLKETNVSKAYTTYQLPGYNMLIVKAITADNMPKSEKVVLK